MVLRLVMLISQSISQLINQSISQSLNVCHSRNIIQNIYQITQFSLLLMEYYFNLYQVLGAQKFPVIDIYVFISGHPVRR